MTNKFTTEQKGSLDLESRLTSMEKDLRFKIEMQRSELESERGKTSLDISSLDTRIQEKYAERWGLDGWRIGWLFDVEFFRLKEELKILRKMYKEHMRVSEEHLEMTYKKEAKEQ